MNWQEYRRKRLWRCLKYGSDISLKLLKETRTNLLGQLASAEVSSMDNTKAERWALKCDSYNTEWHKKPGTFEKPNKNWRNPRKKKLLTEIEPLQLAFEETVIQIMSV